ncbi:hypothetical protein ABZT34_01260 [Streptomyces sp. NPDC005329]|uniref:hypothetical protein n=1 Tax=Streptomyces sp. NPDC005329 TaxID=3157034 RepID=UPI0033BE0FD2
MQTYTETSGIHCGAQQRAGGWGGVRITAQKLGSPSELLRQFPSLTAAVESVTYQSVSLTGQMPRSFEGGFVEILGYRYNTSGQEFPNTAVWVLSGSHWQAEVLVGILWPEGAQNQDWCAIGLD